MVEVDRHDLLAADVDPQEHDTAVRLDAVHDPADHLGRLLEFADAAAPRALLARDLVPQGEQPEDGDLLPRRDDPSAVARRALHLATFFSVFTMRTMVIARLPSDTRSDAQDGISPTRA